MSLPEQIYKAIGRNDLTFVHDQIQCLSNSYFDILFALNRETHPGSKRLLGYATNLEHQPENMSEDVREVLLERDPEKLKGAVERLVNDLEGLLKARGAL